MHRAPGPGERRGLRRLPGRQRRHRLAETVNSLCKTEPVRRIGAGELRKSTGARPPKARVVERAPSPQRPLRHRSGRARGGLLPRTRKGGRRPVHRTGASPIPGRFEEPAKPDRESAVHRRDRSPGQTYWRRPRTTDPARGQAKRADLPIWSAAATRGTQRTPRRMGFRRRRT